MSSISSKLIAVGIGVLLGSTVLVCVGAWRRTEDRARVGDRKREIGLLLEERASGGEVDALAAPERRRSLSPQARAYFLDEDAAESLFYRDRSFEMYDPWSYHRHKPGLNLRVPWPEHPRGEWLYVTNSLGLREDAELMPDKPDLRVLVTGDSQTEGFGDNRDSWPNLLEVALAAERPSATVEVINAANGGFSPYHDLGALERFLGLAPDVFIVAIFAGNDFIDARNPRAWFARTTIPQASVLEVGLTQICSEYSSAATTQGLGSAIALGMRADEVPGLVDCVVGLALEMRALCAEAGTRFLCVLIPSPIDVPGEPSWTLVEEIARQFEMDGALLHFNAELGREFVRRMALHGCAVLDTLPALAAAGAPCFWQKDLHLNLRGQRAIGDAVHARLRADLAAEGR